VSKFSDSLGWYPGLELRNDGRLFNRDIDASVVIPSRDNLPYSVRFVDEEGDPLPDFYGLDVGVGSLLGSGNPGDDGVAYGVTLEVLKAAKDNTYATIRVTPAH
jgi:immune inhibitor A